MSGLRAAAAALVAATGVGMLAACAPHAAALRAEAGARIWDVRAGAFIEPDALAARIAPVRYRLLGEVHDNPAHHRLRAELIEAVGSTGRRPAVVLEQFDLAGEAALQAAQQGGADAEGLATAGALDRRSWRWPLHRPILDAARRAHMPVHAGNASRAELGVVMRTGELTGIDPAVRARLARASWSGAQAAELAEDIRASHCNKLSEASVPRLVLAQRVRDAAMAEALARDATGDGAILVAGNGHVRRDLAVPVYLDAVSRDIVSVAWLEATAEAMRAPDFPRRALGDRAGFDYVWFTPPVAREDPCLGMP